MRTSRSTSRFARTELAGSVVLALGLWWVLHMGHVWPDIRRALSGERDAFYGALAAVNGALLGFVIATLAIVVGYVESPRFAPVRNSTHYATLYGIFTAAVRALGVATVTALVALLVDRDSAPNRAMFDIVTASTALAIFRLAHCIWTLERMISVVVTSGPREPGA